MPENSVHTNVLITCSIRVCGHNRNIGLYLGFGHQRSSLYVRLFTFSYINSLTYLVNPTKRENSDTNRIVAGVWGLVAGAALIFDNRCRCWIFCACASTPDCCHNGIWQQHSDLSACVLAHGRDLPARRLRFYFIALSAWCGSLYSGRLVSVM